MASPNRREFLGLLAGGVTATALPSTRMDGTPAARLERLAGFVSQDDDEAFWRLVKREFPIRPNLLMMNCANLCPSPLPVIDTVTRLTRDVDADASFQNRGKFGELRTLARNGLAQHVGADPGEIAITRNTSEGNNTVVNGLGLGPGDEVVIWSQNHPTNNASWDVRAERLGFTVTKVATPHSPRTSDELVEPFIRALNANTRVLSVTHVSNVSGIQLPAKTLCAEARRRGILAMVDGAQTFGALRLDLHDMGCDFFTSSSHKWFVGPKEAGLLYVRAERIGDLWANNVGVGYAGAVRNGAQKFDNLGQRDDACVAAMGTAAAFHDTIGIDRIEARIRRLATRLIEQLQTHLPDIAFTTPLVPELRAGVVIFSHPGVAGGTLFSRLYEEHDVAGARRGAGVRLCPHIYHTLDDVDRAARAVAEVVAG